MEKQAKERQRQAGGDHKKKNPKPLLQNSVKAVKPKRVVEQISKKSGIGSKISWNPEYRPRKINPNDFAETSYLWCFSAKMDNSPRHSGRLLAVIYGD